MVEWFEFFFIKNIPGKIGRILRRGYWSTRFSRYARFSIYTGCEITSPRKISIANGVTIASDCKLYAHNGGSIRIEAGANVNTNVMLNAADNGAIVIGKDVLIGPNVIQ